MVPTVQWNTERPVVWSGMMARGSRSVDTHGLTPVGIYSVQTAEGLLLPYSTPAQLCFPPVAGSTVRADYEGGALSSDFGVLLLRGIDRQVGLTSRLAAALRDERHPSSVDHPLRDLIAQRV